MLTTLKMKECLFPKNFLFGAGGAGHQIEGDNIHSQFNQWERENRPNFPVHSGKACNSWELYDEDIRIMKELGLQIYRMSVEWSRIEPEQGKHDEKALARYIDILEKLNSAGIKVSLTLHHWSHPNFFEELGGFEKRENIHYFTDHLNYLVPKIKDYVYQWNVLNEFSNNGTNPAAFNLMKNETIAHAMGYHTIKQYSDRPVSSTHAVIPWRPFRYNDPMDRAAAKVLDWSTNEYMIHAFETGEMVLPYTEAEFCPELKGAFDYWALNYYTRHMASGRTKNMTMRRHECDRVSMIDEDMYHEEFYPDGFIEELPRYKNKPIFICENGVCCDDDRIRLIYLARHMMALRDAMDQGVDLRGYIHWSFLDNYEWGSFKPRFGLVHVDFDTFKREIKQSGRFFSEMIKNHGITYAMRDKYLKPLSDITTYELPMKSGS